MASLINVGSFHRKQIASILGSFLGMGLSVGILGLFPFLFAIVFLILALFNFANQEAWKIFQWLFWL